MLLFFWFLSIRRRHTSFALGTGVQTCALPILPDLPCRRAVHQQTASAHQQRLPRTLSGSHSDRDGIVCSRRRHRGTLPTPPLPVSWAVLPLMCLLPEP